MTSSARRGSAPDAERAGAAEQIEHTRVAQQAVRLSRENSAFLRGRSSAVSRARRGKWHSLESAGNHMHIPRA